MKFVQEKRLISKFFDEISQASNKYVFGVKDTLTCLEMGAVETLIVWENFDVNRYVVLKPNGALGVSGRLMRFELTSQPVFQ